MASDTALADTTSTSRNWQVPVFFLGLVALIVVALARPFLIQCSPNNPERLLQSARADLKAEPPAVDSAIQCAQRIAERTELAPRQRAEAHFILGSALLKKAESEPEESGQHYQQSRHHLEHADRLGVPESDRIALTVRLAKAWLATRADPELVIRSLRRIADESDDPYDLYQMLAEAHRRKQPTDFAGLLDAMRQQIARAPASADPSKLAQARMQLAEMLLQAKNSRDAAVVLKRLAAEASPDLAFAARKLLAQCSEEAQDWPAAAQAWTQIRDDARLPANEKAKVLLALGRSLLQCERPDEAAAAWQSAAAMGGPDGQAAALRLAELRCTTDPRTAMTALADALGGVTSPDNYSNPVIPLAELQTVFERCGDQLRQRGDFESAVQLSRIYAKVAPPGKALAQQADATAAWAEDMVKKGQPGTAAHADAARLYLAAAGTEANAADIAKWLWQAANFGMKAADEKLALESLNRYVQMESVVGPERIAAELYTIGGVYERMNNQAEARTAYQRCAAASNAVRFKARYALARLDLVDARRDEEMRQNPKLDDAEKLQLELRARLKFDDAEKMLQDNLSELRQAAQPDASVQELTVFGLADIAYERGDYAMADPRLRGALQEYPQSGNSIRARNQLALCIWRKAIEEFRTLSNDKISEDQRRRLQKQLVDNLNQSADHFAQVERALMERPWEALSATERECLTKAAFSVGDVQCVAGRYQDALNRYEELVKRFSGSVYELHAIRQVWHCHFYYFKDDAKALEQLSRLRDTLERLPASAFDGRSDLHQREYWIERIVDMGKSMNKS